MTTIVKKVIAVLVGCACGGGAAYGLSKLFDKKDGSDGSEGGQKNSGGSGTRSGWTPPEDPDEPAEAEHPREEDDPEEAEEGDPGVVYRVLENSGEGDGIVQIDEGTFFARDDDCTRDCLEYYQENQTLVDKNEEIVQYPERVLGGDFQQVASLMLDSESCYFMNLHRKIKYEVVVHSEAYRSPLSDDMD